MHGGDFKDWGGRDYLLCMCIFFPSSLVLAQGAHDKMFPAVGTKAKHCPTVTPSSLQGMNTREISQCLLVTTLYHPHSIMGRTGKEFGFSFLIHLSASSVHS